jgi:CheY-like chemotaxis protein
LLPPLGGGDAVEETAESAAARNAALQLKGRVLLVDDEPAVSEFMQDLLEDWGLTITVFNSSVDACATFSDGPDRYALVILDYTMPGMTGLELAQQLLKLRPGLPVILYTGYSDEISADQVREAGIRALVNKPVDTARLYELVQRLLREGAAS